MKVNQAYTSQKAGYVPAPYFLKLPKCEAIDMKITFYVNETHYHKKGFALSLVLKVRVFANVIGVMVAN